MTATEIHHVLCAAYSQNLMSEGNVRQWCRTFKDERTNEQMFKMKSEVVSRSFVVNDDLFSKC
jgi:hypothetical protein